MNSLFVLNKHHIHCSSLVILIGEESEHYSLHCLPYDRSTASFQAHSPHSAIQCLLFNVPGSVHPNNILIYSQQDATLHSLFYLKTALHVSGGTITHQQERKQLYLQHLVFVIPLFLSAAIVEELELV